MNDELLFKIGQKIRFERMKRGLSQDELADLSGFSTNAISTLERGVNNARIKTMFQIAKALDMDIRDLLDFKF